MNQGTASKISKYVAFILVRKLVKHYKAQKYIPKTESIKTTDYNEEKRKKMLKK